MPAPECAGLVFAMILGLGSAAQDPS